jgi:hypothetical protein
MLLQGFTAVVRDPLGGFLVSSSVLHNLPPSEGCPTGYAGEYFGWFSTEYILDHSKSTSK